MVEATKHPPLDDRLHHRTIAIIGGEDRALLRSNPSARSDAGTEAGVRTTSGFPPTSTCSGHQAQNLGGPGAEPPQRFEPRAVCHLARSSASGLPRANAEARVGAVTGVSGSDCPPPCGRGCPMAERVRNGHVLFLRRTGASIRTPSGGVGETTARPRRAGAPGSDLDPPMSPLGKGGGCPVAYALLLPLSFRGGWPLGVWKQRPSGTELAGISAGVRTCGL